MGLTNCKECNKEVSTEARTCPNCGIDNPGGGDKNNRRVGVVVLALLIFLCLYIFTRHERANYQSTEHISINEKTATVVANVGHEANATQASAEQIKLIEEPSEKISAPLKQPSLQSSADTPQMMVMRMLEYALNGGGLSHESEIQQTKFQIENLPKPAEGNKKAARALNTKGLALSKNGDFNKAVKLFEEANKLDKSDIEIVNNLGFSYLKQGNLDSAQQAITLALTMSPGRATAWENLGEVFGLKGNVSKSVACFSNAYRFSKERIKMHQNLKILNAKEGVKKLKQARAEAINWAQKSYLNIEKVIGSEKMSN